MTVVAIVPAAGAAERFGGAKLLADVGGTALIARTLEALLPSVATAVVVVAPNAHALRALPALHDPKVRVVENPDPSRGMLSSLQAGLPADMPYVRESTVRKVVERQACTSGGIVSPKHNGKRGHPIALPAGLRDEILAEDVTHTLHDVIRRHAREREDLEVDDPGVIRDVDTMEDLRR